MNPLKTTRWLAVVALLATGCGDEPRNVGNDTDSGSVDVPFDITRTDTGVDASMPTDRGNDTGAVDTGNDTGPVDTGTVDAGPADTGNDTGPVDTGAVDAGPADTGNDTGPADAGPADTGNDTGPADTGAVDAGPTDAGPVDAGPRDAGPADTGVVDAGPMDAGPTDAGNADVVMGDGAVCVPAAETCNGRDDDCDGLIDESGCTPHIVISELAFTPTLGEFVEIYNPTNAPVDLTNVYLADVNDYGCRLPGVTCSTTPGNLSGGDFSVRFPAGSVLMPGQYATITLNTADAFRNAYGRCPNYYISRIVTTDGGVADAGPDAGPEAGNCNGMSAPMLPSISTSVSVNNPGLTDTGEFVVLFSWSGTSPLVTDLDYVVFGSPSTANTGVNKSGVMATFNSMTATYRADTPFAMQTPVTAHPSNSSNIRCNFGEGSEGRTNGNGVMNHDETSENWSQTWRSSPVVPASDAGVNQSASPGADNNCR